MAYDRDLADRIRVHLSGTDGIVEKQMFGGLAFLVRGHMAVAASGQGGLMVRVDPGEAEEWMDGETVAPMVMRGREMRGWLRVATPLTEEELERWVARGVAFARALPPKKG
jgi:hypothetical protein